jgi:hypothetical protein
MAKKKEKIATESYLLIKDGDGFKVLHPNYGPCLLTNYDGEIIQGIFFETAVVGEHPERGSTEIWGEGGSIGETAEDLKNDGYTSKEVKKMKLHVEMVATF